MADKNLYHEESTGYSGSLGRQSLTEDQIDERARIAASLQKSMGNELGKKESEDFKFPKHEFEHSVGDDPRQMLLTEMQKDGKDYQAAFAALAESWKQRQIAPKPEIPEPPKTNLELPYTQVPELPAPQVEVRQEHEQAVRPQMLEQEAAIDAEFHEIDPDSPQGPVAPQMQATHLNTEVETPVALETTPEGDFRYDAHLNAEISPPDPETLIDPAGPQAEGHNTHVTRDLPEPQQERHSVVEAVRADIAADKTVVVTATEYSPDVQRLIEEARAQGHRVQVAVIGEQQEGRVTLNPEQLQSVPELSKDSHYVSVYTQNDAGNYDLHGTNYNDQAKVTPSTAPEIGKALAQGVEAKGLNDNVIVQQVDRFKESHPAATKMQAQPNRGMDFQ